MPLHRPAVDVEALLVGYLTTRAPVVALIGPTGASTSLPRSWTAGDRYVRLTRLGGVPDAIDPSARLDRARVQFDVFGADEADAHAVAAQVLVELLALVESPWRYDGAVVTAVKIDTGLTNSPDRGTDAARYLFGVILYVHAVGA